MALEIVNMWTMDENGEGVDREAFKKIVDQCKEWGTVTITNAYALSVDYLENLSGLFKLKLHGRCGKVCSWLIWRDEPKNCWWIQHNLNPEHVYKMDDYALGCENLKDLGWHTGEIKHWVNMVHQEEDAYLEEIDDSFRATIRKRHERSVAHSDEDRDGVFRLRDDSAPPMENVSESRFRSTQKQDGGFYLSYGREDVGFSGMAHLDFKPIRFG